MATSYVTTYSACPVCASASIRPVLSARDYTVSGEEFAIWECSDCTLRFTQQVPGSASIGRYYQSDNYISHTNSSKGLVNRLYHIARRFTMNNKRNLIHRLTGLSRGQLLDVGAGVGAFAGFMRQSGWQVTGLEPDEATRRRAATQYHIQLLPSEELFALPAGTFDAITMWHVLEHVHALHEYMNRLKELLKPGGLLFIAVPNYTSYDASVYGQYWAAYDVPRHLYHFSPASMRQLLKEHGLVLRDVKPMWFDSLYVSMLSEKYKTGKARLAKAFVNGWASNRRAMRDPEKCSSLTYIISR